jgi:hypothetical protein
MVSVCGGLVALALPLSQVLPFLCEGTDPWWPSEYEKPHGKRQHTVLFLGEGAGCFGDVANSSKAIADWDENFAEVVGFKCVIPTKCVFHNSFRLLVLQAKESAH